MLQRPAFKTLTLGVGNRLMSDEGIGIHIIERLSAGYDIDKEVQVLDGGTLGLDLLYYLEGIENLLLIDAVETHKPAGAIIRLEDEQVPAFMALKISPHQVGVPDMLAAAKMLDAYPKRLTLWGIQPETLDMGLDLSPLLEEKAPQLLQNVIEELRGWGHTVSPKT
ncbi:MAG: HyaD/HybD family hydrogenase maturation endopeptidase [Anaerolineales bacterium]